MRHRARLAASAPSTGYASSDLGEEEETGEA